MRITHGAFLPAPTMSSSSRPLRRSKRLQNYCTLRPDSHSSSSPSTPSSDHSSSSFTPSTPPSAGELQTSPPPSPELRSPPRKRRVKATGTASALPQTAPSSLAAKPTELTLTQVRRILLSWYAENARPLPWRTEKPDPYAILVSEIMSQQTRISVVIDYYTRWMETFPTPVALANASLDKVNTLWAGLGYYRRAKNLHEAAKIIARDGMPDNVQSLMKLPGIGRYTAGAVASIAFEKNVPAVDGNVQRVLGRLWPGMEGEAVWEVMEVLTREKAGYVNQGVMEFGATVCTPKRPGCKTCGLRDICGARREAEERGLEVEEYVVRYPAKKKKAKVREEKVSAVVVVRKDGRVWMVKREEGGLLGGLWEVPNVVGGKVEDVVKELGGREERAVEVGSVVHVFSHIRQTIDVWVLMIKEGEEELEGGRWIKGDLQEVGISTQMKKVIRLGLSKMPKARKLR